jgi:hypothetical protein
MQRLSLIISTLALVVALTGVGLVQAGVLVTSKQIKNGTILSEDIHRGGVKTSDVANGTVSSADIGNGDIASVDIGANEVEPSDLELPAPVEATPDEATGSVAVGEFSKLATVAELTKVQAESVLEVTWSGAIAPGPSTNCIYQLRVNEAIAPQGGGEAFAQTSAVNVSTTATFSGVPAGPISIEVWAKARAAATPTPSCILGPANPGIDTTIVAIEQIV